MRLGNDIRLVESVFFDVDVSVSFVYDFTQLKTIQGYFVS